MSAYAILGLVWMIAVVLGIWAIAGLLFHDSISHALSLMGSIIVNWGSVAFLLLILWVGFCGVRARKIR